MNLYVHAAGIFDVAGSILLTNIPKSKNKHKYPQIRLTGTAKKFTVIFHLKQEFGGYVSEYSNTDKGSPRIWWQLNGRKAIKFMKEIKPFMKNEHKKNLAQYIINHYEELKKLRKDKHLSWSDYNKFQQPFYKSFKMLRDQYRQLGMK